MQVAFVKDNLTLTLYSSCHTQGSFVKFHVSVVNVLRAVIA
jgi:hypothetical protein